ncbi:periphilin-1-like isoform X2 [Ochotona princeps]|uniref:periphilin-1-like isoform X2 n=1 Tax=Ochotona princeps TaxID=9978 RepID=UPI002714546C|nr:periphilin-1-like isoform X2 [Ochotona princeps]
MWPQGRCDYERPPRGRVPRRSHPADGDSPCRWPGWGLSASRQPQHGERDMRDGFRRTSVHSSSDGRDRCPRERGAPLLPGCSMGRKDCPCSGSCSSVGSRSYSAERSKTYSLHQHQSQERPVQSLQTSRDTSPAAVPSSKAEATTPLLIEQPEAPESSAPQGVEFFEDSQLSTRSKAIATKTREIEEVYRQDCETFGLVVKMLVEKDPSLAKSIQPALRQNLQELAEHCVGELQRFIAQYDTASPGLGEPPQEVPRSAEKCF